MQGKNGFYGECRGIWVWRPMLSMIDLLVEGVPILDYQYWINYPDAPATNTYSYNISRKYQSDLSRTPRSFRLMLL
jgi:hypothetical protein